MNRRERQSSGRQAPRSVWSARVIGGTLVPLAVVSLGLTACSEDDVPKDAYHPAEVVEILGADVKQVVFTADAARRVQLRTATVETSGPFMTVPYEALIYDGQGESWVYAVSEELSFLRHAVTVNRVEADVAFLSAGLRKGDTVVTTGSTQVYGEELGIGGSH